LQTLPAPSALAWGAVLGDQSEAAPVLLRWWGDGALMLERRVTDIKPFRLPPGRPLEHQFEIESAARVTRVQFASSTRELQGI
jgi:hypothetical protein